MMKTEVEDMGSHQIVRLSGVLDGSIRQFSDDKIQPLIENQDSRIMVDLSGVDRLTSEAIAVFVTMVSRCNSKGSRLVFVNPSPFVQAIFDITKITKFLATFETAEEGLAQLLAPKQ